VKVGFQRLQRKMKEWHISDESAQRKFDGELALDIDDSQLDLTFK
jgi:hypothetical protein